MTHELQRIIDTVNARFKSGNAIPVERAMISAREWEIVRGDLILMDLDLTHRSEIEE